jgi:hypothetical protein
MSIWIEEQEPPSWADQHDLARRAHDALATDALAVLVRTLYAGGLNEGQVLGVLERLRAALRMQQREEEEDVVMEVMDRVVGSCSPQNLLRHRDGTP